MFVSLSSVLLFFVAGLFVFTYAGALAILSAGITYISVKLITKHVERSGRGSIIVLFLTIVLAVSSIITPLYGFFQEKDKAENGIDIWTFNSFC